MAFYGPLINLARSSLDTDTTIILCIRVCLTVALLRVLITCGPDNQIQALFGIAITSLLATIPFGAYALLHPHISEALRAANDRFLSPPQEPAQLFGCEGASTLLNTPLFQASHNHQPPLQTPPLPPPHLQVLRFLTNSWLGVSISIVNCYHSAKANCLPVMKSTWLYKLSNTGFCPDSATIPLVSKHAEVNKLLMEWVPSSLTLIAVACVVLWAKRQADEEAAKGQEALRDNHPPADNQPQSKSEDSATNTVSEHPPPPSSPAPTENPEAPKSPKMTAPEPKRVNSALAKPWVGPPPPLPSWLRPFWQTSGPAPVAGSHASSTVPPEQLSRRGRMRRKKREKHAKQRVRNNAHRAERKRKEAETADKVAYET